VLAWSATAPSPYVSTLMSVAVTTEPLSDDIAPGEPAPRVSMPPRVIAILPPRRAIAPAARSPVVVTRVSVASMTGVSAYSFDAYSPCALVPSVITRVRECDVARAHIDAERAYAAGVQIRVAERDRGRARQEQHRRVVAVRPDLGAIERRVCAVVADRQAGGVQAAGPDRRSGDIDRAARRPDHVDAGAFLAARDDCAVRDAELAVRAVEVCTVRVVAVGIDRHAFRRRARAAAHVDTDAVAAARADFRIAQFHARARPDAAAPAATGPVENARVLAVVVRCPPLIADSTARPTWVVE
jgi:hypothetical protein